METVSRQAVKVLEDLRRRAQDARHQGAPATYIKIDHSEAFMPVSVELLGLNGLVEHWAIGHWYRQNGDAMRDPEVEFIRLTNERRIEWYPCSYRQDPYIFREYVRLNSELLPIRWLDIKAQTDCARFCGVWMRNIKTQQGLRV